VLSCDELGQAYREALAEAKACEPGGDSPCTEEVDDALACPCPTFINPGNEDAVAELASLASAWKEADCSKGIDCPAIECDIPKGAQCDSSGSGSGHCEDGNGG
jgi:hypothetical protein